MTPVIFTVEARWDSDASVWWGRCDAVPIAAEAVTLDGLLAKAAAQTFDLLPDNHPGIEPEHVGLQIAIL